MNLLEFVHYFVFIFLIICGVAVIRSISKRILPIDVIVPLPSNDDYKKLTDKKLNRKIRFRRILRYILGIPISIGAFLSIFMFINGGIDIFFVILPEDFIFRNIDERPIEDFISIVCAFFGSAYLWHSMKENNRIMKLSK